MDKKQLSNIKCIAYDFDGVMTDNRALVIEDGREAVFCNRSDGLAIAGFKELGIRQIIISTETNPVVEARAKKSDIEALHGVKNKGAALTDFCDMNGIDQSEVLYIGNDINDLSAFMVAGMTGAPADAEKEIYGRADWKSTRKGGYGVIRELYGQYLEAVRDKE